MQEAVFMVLLVATVLTMIWLMADVDKERNEEDALQQSLLGTKDEA